LIRKCKKCNCAIHPIEKVGTGGNYSTYTCPVCGANVSMGRTKTVMVFIGLAFIAFAVAYFYIHHVR